MTRADFVLKTPPAGNYFDSLPKKHTFAGRIKEHSVSDKTKCSNPECHEHLTALQIKKGFKYHSNEWFLKFLHFFARIMEPPADSAKGGTAVDSVKTLSDIIPVRNSVVKF